ncbi:MAG: hypothetical protein MJ138_02875 [Kiritimatiellae bacterium]|nr:hypothetical protein [Kiritimatiellia bacterium]
MKHLTFTLGCAAAFGAFAAADARPGSLAARVAADFPQMPASGICRYAVPATGERQYLPDAYPEDGVPGAPCSIVAARDEYEPGSFVLYATKDFGKVQFKTGDLRNEKGAVIPAKELDLKVVKVWYQNGNGWYSYFQDVGKRLCPELLLNDEDLVRVDEKTEDNYARLTEKDGKVSWFWITAPRPAAKVRTPEVYQGYGRSNEPFLCMKENFQDAKEFRGATLQAGRCKQFFLTAHVAKDAKPGLYKGAIRLEKDGRKIDEVPVALRVHDFTLPKPKCYFDVEKDYVTWFCEYVGLGQIMTMNGGDMELAKRQLPAILANYARHGHVTPCFRDAGTEWGRKVALEAGLDYTHAGMGGTKRANPAEMRLHAELLARRLDREIGHHKGVMLGWGDEYGLGTLRTIREMIKTYHEKGFIFSINSRYGYDAGANVADVYWPPVEPDGASAAQTAKFNDLGGAGWFGWYANHHVGPENPAFNRRQYGFGPYRAGLSCNYNYAHHLDGWNDIAPSLYKPMMLVYGTGSGCVDTLAWEGFREGLDDIRYATKLKQLALPLSRGENVEARYAAKLALKLLADADRDDMDLAALRLEMIEWILKLQTFKTEG